MQFPPYLANPPKPLSDEDKERYGKQLTCVNKIVAIFEQPSYSDSDAEAGKKVVELMSEVRYLLVSCIASEILINYVSLPSPPRPFPISFPTLPLYSPSTSSNSPHRCKPTALHLPRSWVPSHQVSTANSQVSATKTALSHSIIIYVPCYGRVGAIWVNIRRGHAGRINAVFLAVILLVTGNRCRRNEGGRGLKSPSDRSYILNRKKDNASVLPILEQD